jgi:oral-facial-digital syndrome 1 protein
MVADYLRECGLERSLAVFVPECKITKHMFKREDILSALHVQKDSKLHQRLIHTPHRTLTDGSAATEAEPQSPPSDILLLRLLDEVSGLFVQRNVDSGTQTELNGPDHREVMEERLRLVQQEYLHQAEHEREEPRRTMEERFLTYQQEVDERGRAEIKEEIERFKETELGRVTQNESAKARQQVHEQLRQMESQYAARLAKLQEAEHKQEQLVAYKMRNAEAELYEQRQRLLAQMDALKGREDQLKQSVALDSRAIQLEEKRLQDKERALQRREEQLEREFERRSGEEEARMAEWRGKVRQEFGDREQGLVRGEAELQLAKELLLKEEQAHAADLDRVGALETELCAVKEECTSHRQAREVLQKELPQLHEHLKIVDAAVRREREARERAETAEGELRVRCAAAEAEVQEVRKVTSGQAKAGERELQSMTKKAFELDRAVAAADATLESSTDALKEKGRRELQAEQAKTEWERREWSGEWAINRLNRLAINRREWSGERTRIMSQLEEARRGIEAQRSQSDAASLELSSLRRELVQSQVSGLLIDSIDSLDQVSGLLIDSIDSSSHRCVGY